MAEAASAVAATVTAPLQGIETYSSGQAELIIDATAAQRSDQPISMATMGSTVCWWPHRLIGANQQIRWSPRGRHRMLKVRTAVANGTLTDIHVAVERWAYQLLRWAD